MNISEILRRLLGGSARLRARPRKHETTDERAARKYWDRQVEDDAERRGVTDRHP